MGENIRGAKVSWKFNEKIEQSKGVSLGKKKKQSNSRIIRGGMSLDK
jgi:hypothetical protein